MDGGRDAYSSGDTMLGDVSDPASRLTNIDGSTRARAPAARGCDVDASSSDEVQLERRDSGRACRRVGVCWFKCLADGVESLIKARVRVNVPSAVVEVPHGKRDLSSKGHKRAVHSPNAVYALDGCSYPYESERSEC